MKKQHKASQLKTMNILRAFLRENELCKQTARRMHLATTLLAFENLLKHKYNEQMSVTASTWLRRCYVMIFKDFLEFCYSHLTTST